MYLDPAVQKFLNEHKVDIATEKFQELFNDWGKYTREHASEDWVVDESQDLLMLLNKIGFTTDYILSKMTELPQYMLYFCNQEELKIPENITHIHDVSLGGNEVIKKLYIPNSVIHIGPDGISCGNMEYLEIPKRFKDQLESITEMGEEELEDITINFI